MNGLGRLVVGILLVLIADQSLAATKIGNGGDAVYCRKSSDPKDPSPGYYSLDYLLTFGLKFGQSVPVSSWEHSSARIEQILQSVSEELADSFLSFTEDVRNTSDYSRPHVWEESPFGLIDLHDENIVTLVPDNCRDGESIKIVQAVVHQPDSSTGRPRGYQLYSFVAKVLDELERTSPIQLSYLYVHEWLWKHSDNVSRNRRINRLLHSSGVQAMNPDQLRTQLEGMGLNLGGERPTRPQPGPEVEPTPPSESEFESAVAPNIQDRAFDAGSYCSGRSRSYGNFINVQVNSKFDLFSRIHNRGSDKTTYAPFGLTQATGRGIIPKTRLLPEVVNLPMAGYHQLLLEAGNVTFKCTLGDLSGAISNFNGMRCYAFDGNGGQLYWPNSKDPITFEGQLFPGCFWAKTKRHTLKPDELVEGEMMMVGGFG